MILPPLHQPHSEPEETGSVCSEHLQARRSFQFKHLTRLKTDVSGVNVPSVQSHYDQRTLSSAIMCTFCDFLSFVLQEGKSRRQEEKNIIEVVDGDFVETNMN